MDVHLEGSHADLDQCLKTISQPAMQRDIFLVSHVYGILSIKLPADMSLHHGTFTQVHIEKVLLP